MSPVIIHTSILLVILLVMLLFWVKSDYGKNPAWVDLAWALSIGLCVLFYAICLDLSQLKNVRTILLIGLPLIWSVRLIAHLYRDRIAGAHTDGRYIHLKNSWGTSYRSKFLLFFLVQGALSYLLSLQFYFGMNLSFDANTWQLILAILIFIVSVGGESIADWQLYAYKLRDPEKKGVCKDGLWYYSRHPNYFFEWLHWTTYVVLVYDSKFFWLALVVAAVMLYLVLYVTGIPPTEEQSLRSRKLAYAEYQQTTNAFFPWFPKNTNLKIKE